MGTKTYTTDDILSGLEILAHSIAKIGLSAHIISPFFGTKMKGKRFYVNHETTPLVIILTDVIFHTYGQLGRIYFDDQINFKTNASIEELNRQIFYKSSTSNNRSDFRNQYEFIKKKLIYARSFKEKMSNVCNKHYAHKEIQPYEQYETERQDLGTNWYDIIKLVQTAKEILNSMREIYDKVK